MNVIDVNLLVEPGFTGRSRRAFIDCGKLTAVKAGRFTQRAQCRWATTVLRLSIPPERYPTCGLSKEVGLEWGPEATAQLDQDRTRMCSQFLSLCLSL